MQRKIYKHVYAFKSHEKSRYFVERKNKDNKPSLIGLTDAINVLSLVYHSSGEGFEKSRIMSSY